jgi:hypothetical protein
MKCRIFGDYLSPPEIDKSLESPILGSLNMDINDFMDLLEER